MRVLDTAYQCFHSMYAYLEGHALDVLLLRALHPVHGLHPSMPSCSVHACTLYNETLLLEMTLQFPNAL